MTALFWTCVGLSLQARSDDQRQAVAALSPEHGLRIPAMKVDAFSGGRAILISGSDAKSVSLGSVPPLSAPRHRTTIEICIEP